MKDGEIFREYPTTEGGYQAFLKEAVGVEVKVINTLKFKVVKEPSNKTDRNNASTIAEFLEMNILPVSRLCSRADEQMRRLLKAGAALASTKAVVKNQIHALLTAVYDKSQAISKRIFLFFRNLLY